MTNGTRELLTLRNPLSCTDIRDITELKVGDIKELGKLRYGYGYLIDNRQIRSRIEGYALSFIVAHFPKIEKVCKLFFNLHTLFSIYIGTVCSSKRRGV